ncbi:MAG TPA: hypothetical protein VG097_01200, partial [Gemmata sp.]|nr:hypothetical protein [Gemmata sp.]
NPIGPFIDNCPMCAEPVRNVCSDNRRSGRPANRQHLLLIGGVLVAVLLLAGYWAFGVRSRGLAIKDAAKANERAKAENEARLRSKTVVVAAAQLLQEFQNNPDSDQKYKGKYLEIFGFVERVGTDGDDAPFIIVNANDEKVPIKIECFFDSASRDEEAQIKRLRKSQTITVRGEYSGLVGNLQVRDCVLVR